ncbi:hypothetical protein AVEN_157473-1 [Araneus ventricosus]|uniref:Histone-lysine N-methyltransferase SETMAR n=1 Tax=Araneus ventricosus TaxID=182803 RepID=A0A4Y2SZ84_ARAVE|nr:hypothetical protein AVEN_238083-1 [Araneus ventricosus]GBO10311.1 hypothetical protein AVEN_157473-1 [Araneus ventricosus]
MLADVHKTKRLGSVLTLLTRYSEEGNEFLHKIVTSDETWVSHVTPESKQQSMEWKRSNQQRCQHAKSCALYSGTDRSFCLLSSFPEVKPSMRYDTAKHFENCGVQFKTKGEGCSVKALCCFMTTHVPILLVSLKTLFKIQLGAVRSPPYSPDLAHSDFHLFLNFKRDFGGRLFDSDDDAENSVQ